MDTVPESSVSDGLKPFQDSKVTLFEETAQSFRGLGAIANHSTHIFSPTISLFPPELVQKEVQGTGPSNDLPSLDEFQRMWEDFKREGIEQQAVADNLPPFQVYTQQEFDADNQELKQILQSVYQERERFQNHYSPHLRWIRAKQPPKLTGLGPAARKALETSDRLNEVFSHLQQIQTAAPQILGRSSIFGEVRDSEELLTIANKNTRQENIKLLATECDEEVYLFQDLHEDLSGAAKKKGGEGGRS